MGLYTYVKGTTFDALNSIDFTYTVDIFTAAAGSGSKKINVDLSGGLKLKATIILLSTSGQGVFNVTVSGDVVSWNLAVSAKILVVGGYD